MITKLRALLAVILLAVAASIGITSEAHATRTPGIWWTNHSRCTFTGLGYIDTQLQYQNRAGSNSIETRVTGAAVDSSGVGNVIRVQITEYQGTRGAPGGSLPYASGAVNLSPAGPDRVVALFLPYFANTYDRNKATYSVTTQRSNGQKITCQGQAPIGNV
jgi:hypothetical protein